MRNKEMRTVWVLLCAAFFTLHSSFFISCSESEDEEANEFGNWQARNEAYFASLEDSLRLGTEWQKIKSYTKDESTAGKNTDYIYVKVLETGDGTESPLFNDSVRVAYRGHYMPTEHYPEGYVFDQTYVGSYSLQTASTAKFYVTAGSPIDGFTTALLHMHRGDRWRVFMPYGLAYGSSSSSVLAYSTLIFEVTLVDFTHPGTPLAVWSARQR